MAYDYCTGSTLPVFISHCAPYNFLREYRLACDDRNIPAMTLVQEARNAWHSLSAQERSLFKEMPYLMARFGQSSASALRLTVNVLSAKQTTVRPTHCDDDRSRNRRIHRGNAKLHSRKRQQKMGTVGRKRSPGIGSTRCRATTYTPQFHWKRTASISPR
ncbi:uncharacterized protein LOC122618656 [Drosophila teissieri]|uniref:uncharacterized protein LOC122618656 n=1 Tax=Drosophila teissieri TaxID=7243 RepID=UPI001CBA1413|nr:uncharacterized protein LOC122618656 [Drosophila teissieri]